MYVSFFFLSLMVHPHLPCPQHQLITIICSLPDNDHSHSVLIKYIIYISADKPSILNSFTVPCCFDPGAVLICHVADDSHLCIFQYIFLILQPSSSVFYLKIQPLITSLSTMHSFVTKSLLDQLAEIIYMFLVKVTNIHL